MFSRIIRLSIFYEFRTYFSKIKQDIRFEYGLHAKLLGTTCNNDKNTKIFCDHL